MSSNNVLNTINSRFKYIVPTIKEYGFFWMLKLIKAQAFCKRTYDVNAVPLDFTHFYFKGQGSTKKDYLVTPHTRNYDYGYLSILDYKGNLKKYKKINGFAYAFRKFRFADNTVRYAYLQANSKLDLNFENSEFVILDEDLNVVRDKIFVLPHGSIKTKNHPIDQHEYVFFAKDHFILLCNDEITSNNIPDAEGKDISILNLIIQEQKAGKVVWQWELIDHLDLIANGFTKEDFDNFDWDKYGHFDPIHANSIDIDKDGNLLVSSYYLGLIKISKKDGSILWVAGKNYCTIKGITKDQLPYFQHHARYHNDGSITLFDNKGNPKNKSRILKYWIDEDKLELIKFKQFETWVQRSNFMGGAQLLHDDTFAITYGGDYGYVGFEEYDFKHKKRNSFLFFDNRHSMYQVFVGEVKVNG